MRPPFLFRVLLRLYPAPFRGEYGDEMWRVVAQRQRDGEGGLALWIPTIGDTLVSAAQTHWDLMRQDLAYALRAFRRTPGFTATVLIVAALGIGVNTAAFSLTDHVLLRPLPYAEPSRLVALWQNQIARGYPRLEVSPPNYRDWKAMTTSYAGMAAHTVRAMNLVGEGQPQRLEGADVTAELMPLLGVKPAFGRTFSAEDDRDGAPGTLLLSYALWQGAFAGDPDVVGRKVRLDGETHVVVGVMPADFAFPNRDTQFWRPMRFAPQEFEDRTNYHLQVVARLAPRVSLRWQAAGPSGQVCAQ